MDNLRPSAFKSGLWGHVYIYIDRHIENGMKQWKGKRKLLYWGRLYYGAPFGSNLSPAPYTSVSESLGYSLIGV